MPLAAKRLAALPEAHQGLMTALQAATNVVADGFSSRILSTAYPLCVLLDICRRPSGDRLLLGPSSPLDHSTDRPAQLGHTCLGSEHKKGISYVFLRRAGGTDAPAAIEEVVAGQLQRALGDVAGFPPGSETAMSTACNEDIAMANGVHRCNTDMHGIVGDIWGIHCLVGC